MPAWSRQPHSELDADSRALFGCEHGYEHDRLFVRRVDSVILVFGTHPPHGKPRGAEDGEDQENVYGDQNAAESGSVGLSRGIHLDQQRQEIAHENQHAALPMVAKTLQVARVRGHEIDMRWVFFSCVKPGVPEVNGTLGTVRIATVLSEAPQSRSSTYSTPQPTLGKHASGS